MRGWEIPDTIRAAMTEPIDACTPVPVLEALRDDVAVRGWRYLRDEDAPPDLPTVEIADVDMPEEMMRELKDLGLD